MPQNDTRKGKAIEALGVGLSVTDASEKAGVTRKTVYRWLDDDDFKSKVAKRQSDVLERVRGRLSALAIKSLDVLEALMDSRNETIRLRASNSVLSRITEILEVLSLEERIEKIESEISNKR
jgi:hypothetical protein